MGKKRDKLWDILEAIQRQEMLSSPGAGKRELGFFSDSLSSSKDKVPDDPWDYKGEACTGREWVTGTGIDGDGEPKDNNCCITWLKIETNTLGIRFTEEPLPPGFAPRMSYIGTLNITPYTACFGVPCVGKKKMANDEEDGGWQMLRELGAKRPDQSTGDSQAPPEMWCCKKVYNILQHSDDFNWVDIILQGDGPVPIRGVVSMCEVKERGCCPDKMGGDITIGDPSKWTCSGDTAGTLDDLEDPIKGLEIMKRVMWMIRTDVRSAQGRGEIPPIPSKCKKDKKE